LRALDEPRPVAEAIAGRHLEELGRGRFRAIAASLGVAEDEVRAAHRFIRDRLSPIAAGELEGDEPLALAAVPDAVIRERAGHPGELAVEVLATPGSALTVDPLYRRLAAEPETDARLHARRFVRRADSFLALLEQRSRTIHRIVVHLADRQARFIREGPRYLLPLTRADVAAALGLHESTVGRAAAGKFVLLPSGRLASLAHFFQASLGLEDALRAVIAAEERPLTDRELGERLSRLGYRVARRTVAKYRARLGAAASALR
jgi:RNA polymerase sigma-54 factor